MQLREVNPLDSCDESKPTHSKVEMQDKVPPVLLYDEA